ncbi:MAG: hypothetical protein AAF721_07135, partial [Myxococcota bacterium]
DEDDEDDELAEPTRAPAGWMQRVAGVVFIAKPVALSVGLAAAGLGVIKGSAMTWHAVTTPVTAQSDADAPAPPEPTPRQSSAGAGARDDAEPALDAVPDPTPALAKPTEVAPVSPASSPTAPSAPRARTASGGAAPRPSSPTVVEDRLRRETLLMRRAKEELEKGQWRTLLATLADHAEQFPEGVLQQERAAWAAIARCNLGQGDAAALTRSFVQRYGASSLADKVRRACETSR